MSAISTVCFQLMRPVSSRACLSMRTCQRSAEPLTHWLALTRGPALQALHMDHSDDQDHKELNPQGHLHAMRCRSGRTALALEVFGRKPPHHGIVFKTNPRGSHLPALLFHSRVLERTMRLQAHMRTPRATRQLDQQPPDRDGLRLFLSRTSATLEWSRQRPSTFLGQRQTHRFMKGLLS